MVDRSDRLQLVSLTDEEIADVLRAVPGLAASWARSVSTDIEWLKTGQPPALAALRAAMARQNDHLVASLARTGLETLLVTLDSAEFDEDIGEGPVELAAAAGRVFGSAAGGVFLSAVAAGSDPFAGEVAGRLAELQDVAARSGAEMSDQSEAAQPSRRVDGAADVAALSALLRRTQVLQQAGIALASTLRVAMDDIEAGRPVGDAGRSLDEWSTAVDEHLSNAAGITDAPDLDLLGHSLADLIDRASEQDRKLRDALRGARLMQEQGLDDLIPGILAATGFESVDQLQAAVEPAAAGAVDAHAETAGDVVPSPGPPPFSIQEHEEERSSATAATENEDSLVTPTKIPRADAGIAPAEIPVIEVPATDQVLRTSTDAGSKPGDYEAARQSMLAGDESLASLHHLDFPWDLGTPPVLADLISEQKYALAVCVAEAAEESRVRQRLLRLLCAAFSCTPTALELQLPELSPAEAEVDQLPADECRVLLAAALRVGFVLGYSPVGLPSLIDRADLGSNGCRGVIEAAAEAVKRGYRRDAEATALQHRDLPREWAAFAADAQRLGESLAHGKANLQRASQVLHHIARKDQPVGVALVMMAELSAEGVAAAAVDAQAGKWVLIEKLATDLSAADSRARIITEADQAVSTKQQLRKAIIAGAWTKLDASLREVADLIARFLAVRSAVRLSSRPADLETANELFRALELQPEDVGVGSVGDAALRQLTAWLRSATPAADAASVEDLIRLAVEPLYEIPRDREGFPVRSADLAEIRELLRGRDQFEVMKGYLEVGNVAAARRIIAAADDLDEAALDDEVSQGRHDARNRHQQALGAVDRVAARLRAVYKDDAARELTELAGPLRVAPNDRFDLTIGPLHELAAKGEDQLGAFRDDLRQRTLGLAGNDAGQQRILELIERDEVLAVEFLTMAEAGGELPVVPERHGDDFSSFFPAMVNAALAASNAALAASNAGLAASNAGRDAVAAVRAAAGATAGPQDRQLAAGLEAWRQLKTAKRGSQHEAFRARVADVLRMLGLVPRPHPWLQEISRTRRSGFATFKVRAAPLGGSYVPSLGTLANQTYDLTLVWDAVTPMRLMDFIEESRRTQANIILYFNTLDPAQRLMLRRQTRYNGGKGFSPVVIDEPVIAWLSTRREPGWRFTQRVTLPFTTINPYTPFAAGEVPDEVFVGREAERQAIEDPTGSMFVYGGRQLGKSALLRRVERLFTESMPGQQAGAGHVAVYLDLKALSIGEAQEPAALWTVLAQRLQDRGVLSLRPGRAVGPDEVIQQVTQWLNSDDGNRLLLLLDEADNFLTADSQAGRSDVGGEFPTLQHLKGLMAASSRRFKAVLAGLHQVQRFHDSSNTPVAHGGDDILVGPLGSRDAYHLVVDPMTALGYEFESPDVVWRLLLLTNYQASLVQIVCEALVKELSRRDLPGGGGRIVVTGGDVESVYAKRDVRDLIVQRFRWTINLDSRYRVIALVVALHSLDSDPGDTFTPERTARILPAVLAEGLRPGRPERQGVRAVPQRDGRARRAPPPRGPVRTPQPQHHQPARRPEFPDSRTGRGTQAPGASVRVQPDDEPPEPRARNRTRRQAFAPVRPGYCLAAGPGRREERTGEDRHGQPGPGHRPRGAGCPGCGPGAADPV